MSRAHRHEHAEYVRYFYHMDFGNFSPDVHDALQQRQFSRLPPEFFSTMKEKGYAVSRDSLASLDGLVGESAGLSGLVEEGNDLVVINRFNIFGSTRQDAILSVVRNSGLLYLFLTAQYHVLNLGETQPETLPICAEKRFYGQPLLLQEVLKRAKHGRAQA